MLLKDSGFPYEQLTDQNKKWIKDLCGGSPIDNRDHVRHFMLTSGRPLLGNGLMREYFDDIAWRSINSVDMHSRAALRAYNRGLLFYAGVLGEVSRVATIPYDQHVLGRIGDADPQNFALESLQAVQESVPSFCELTEEARPALDTDSNSRLHQVVLMGAGALHLVVTESLDAVTSTDAEVLDGFHDELSDLQALADRLGNQF